jgi:NTP pyrophosphatase (non-canonical NTP hydrolase)
LTDQFPRRRAPTVGEVTKEELVPLLGLTGEVGTLLSEYKKLLRDGPVHLRFQDRLAEDLGDTLWYVAAVATKFGLSLDEIAEANLRKVRDRWAKLPKRKPFDRAAPRAERLPTTFRYRFEYAGGSKAGRLALVDERGQQIGDLLTDNAHVDDGYRFHDVMHFAFVAMLGWSPVARKILARKRRTDAKTDEIEDGGRANVIDEAIVAMVFDYIHHDLAGSVGLKRIDSETLRSIRALTRGFEVHVCTEGEWEAAILRGLEVWRQVDAHDGGIVVGDQVARTFAFKPPGVARGASRSGRGSPSARQR